MKSHAWRNVIGLISIPKEARYTLAPAGGWLLSEYFFHVLHILSQRGDSMASYVSPAVRDKFETLSVELKNTILERNVQLNTIYDLINVLEQIVAESDE